MSPIAPERHGHRRGRKIFPSSSTPHKSLNTTTLETSQLARSVEDSVSSHYKYVRNYNATPGLPPRPTRRQTWDQEQGVAHVMGRKYRTIIQHPNHRLMNSERFFVEYLTRPRPSRTRSEPPSPRRIISVKRAELEPMPHIRRSINRAMRYGRSGVVKLRQGFESSRRVGSSLVQRFWKHKRAIALAIVILAAMRPLAIMHRNGKAYANQPPPAIVANFKTYPTWMHISSAYQVLALPEPLDLAWVPRMTEVDAAFRQANKRVHPDKWRVNGFEDQASAECAQKIIGDAHNLFERYWKSPYCALRDRGNDSGLLQPMATLEYMARCGIPSFSNACSDQCTFSVMATEGLKALLTNPERQKRAPESLAELVTYCPCSWTKKIGDLMKNLDRERIPPPGIRRYWGEIGGEQNNWKAWGCFQYPPFLPRISRLRRWWYSRNLLPFNWSAAKVKRLEEQGWLVDDDISIVPEYCSGPGP